jgi:subtilisin-like proprotein convertase family protein
MKVWASNLSIGPTLAVVALLSVSLVTSAKAQSNNGSGSDVAGMPQMSDSARQQIRNLLAEKEARTPVQRKIGSSLIYRAKRKQGIELIPGAANLRSLVAERKDGLVDVQITGRISKALVTQLTRAGGRVIYGHVNGPLLRALVPIEAVETLAASPDVRNIREALPATTQQQLARHRAEALRGALTSAVEQKQFSNGGVKPQVAVDDRGSVVSQGVAAHRADVALQTYGATGAGIKVGVLSDSDDFQEAAIASGDLPPDAFTIPGQSGRPGSGEGTAMMEIVHDMAPGAKLFFATAFNSPESFADNIRTLRFVYHCDIIVDDAEYYAESPYQDDIIAHAVNDVTADGASYFSSAGNQGNSNDGTSGTWEGDFRLAKNPLATLPSGYQVHDFGKGVVGNRVTSEGGPLFLHWSDPGSIDVPAATDDYDLFLLDADLRNVLIASTDVQDGSDIPFEFLNVDVPVGDQVVIARHPTATDRALLLELSGGELALSTAGATFGHNAAAAAFSVAAVNVAEAGGGAFSAGQTTPVELFSSDGNRRVFFDQDGNPYKPGKFLIKNNGGQIRFKPDLSAADGVSTTLPPNSDLNPFFGTSAAAPHAAGIAALVRSIKPKLLAGGIRAAMKSSSLDIGVPGRDTNSGYGIVDAVGTLSAAHATPEPFLELGTITATPITGDGDPFIEPGESASLLTELRNAGGASTINLRGVLSTTTPGVTIGNANSTFPAIPGFGGSAPNDNPFTFTLAPDATCGLAPEFHLTATYNGPVSPETLDFKVQTGTPDPTIRPAVYTGGVVPIPDGNATGVNVPLTVTGIPGAISKLTFTIGGSSCTAAQGATTVGIDHSWIGDLDATLTSPSGTTISLFNRAGGENNSGNNFCQTTLDDAGTNSIQNIAIAGAPWVGTFSPAAPLAAFIGEDPNGVWILHMTDHVTIDSGSVRAFALNFTGFGCN